MTFPWLVVGALGTAAVAWILARATRQYALIAAVAGAVVLYLHGWLYFHLTSDDAYISFRYARNLAEGRGLVWNPGQHVEGYTNFSWVLLLAGLTKAGADTVVSARWAGFGFAVIAGAATYLLATQLATGAAGRVGGLVAALLLAACGSWAAWATAGLENPMFGAIAVVAVLLHLREQDGQRMPLSGAAWAVAAMTRPDAIALAGMSGAFKLAEAALRARRDRRSIRREAIRLLAWAAGFALIYAPYFAWRYHEYGWFYPNTYYAKVGSGTDQWARGLAYLASIDEQYALVLLLLVPFAATLGDARPARLLYVFALVVTWLGYVVYVGGDSLVRLRLFAPIAPLFYAAVAGAGAALVASLARGRPRLGIEAAGIVAVAGLMAFTLHASGTDDGIPADRRAVADRVTIGRWLRREMPDETTVALIPAGAIPYESRLPSIDMLGLNDEHIAHADVPLGKFGAGHEKFDTAYVLGRSPDIIIMQDELTSSPWQQADYDILAGGIIPARIDMLRNAQLWLRYQPRTVKLGEGRWFNLLVRNDAQDVLARTQFPLPAR